jgi:hypothetical protein
MTPIKSSLNLKSITEDVFNKPPRGTKPNKTFYIKKVPHASNIKPWMVLDLIQKMVTLIKPLNPI